MNFTALALCHQCSYSGSNPTGIRGQNANEANPYERTCSAHTGRNASQFSVGHERNAAHFSMKLEQSSSSNVEALNPIRMQSVDSVASCMAATGGNDPGDNLGCNCD